MRHAAEMGDVNHPAYDILQDIQGELESIRQQNHGLGAPHSGKLTDTTPSGKDVKYWPRHTVSPSSEIGRSGKKSTLGIPDQTAVERFPIFKGHSRGTQGIEGILEDRKSTRLNSSHRL